MENSNDEKINQTPSMPIPQKHDSRYTLFAVAFAFMIVYMVGIGIGAISLIVRAATLSTSTVTLPDLDIDMAKVLRVILWIIVIIMLASFAWNIPFTIKVKKYMQTLETPSIAFGILILIFSNIISGILVLVASSMQPKTNY